MPNARPPAPPPPLASAQLAALLDLAECETPAALLQALHGILARDPAVAAVSVCRLEEAEADLESLAALAEAQDQDWLNGVALRGEAALSPDGQQLGYPLLGDAGLLLSLQLRDAKAAPDFLGAHAALLHLASRQLQRNLVQTRLAHSEKLQRALFAITELAAAELDMPSLLRGIHAIIGELMYAENLFIVRYNADDGLMRFIYYVDAEDPEYPEGGRDMPVERLQGSLTWYLLHDGKPLMGTTDELRLQVSGPLNVIGADSFDWLGVPMRQSGKVLGALVVQSYREGIRFSDEDRALLEFVGNHVIAALERKRSHEELEEGVRQRTVELAEANLVLQEEILERKHAEQLQAALFQIAQLAGEDIDEAEFYRRVHAVVGELINCENFYIGLVSEDRSLIEFPYFVDVDGHAAPAARPMGRGLSEYVIRNGRPFMGPREHIRDLVRQGEIELHTAGRNAAYWLGVPLIAGDEVIGLVAVQSLSDAVAYGPADQDLLSFVASQIANSLHRRRYAQLLLRANFELE
ncbi:MAG TPA: GAF domain-containing protein, partial [Arenimonas sp.]|nr:GAF domain-containing protein [Arenimonas sp.]